MSMPASAVNVSATFKYAPKYNITLNTSENGSVSADMQTATECTTVTLTVIPDEGYELDKVLRLIKNDIRNAAMCG